MAHPLNVMFVGTYPPRRCGIATFTRDLQEACRHAVRGSVQIVALNARGDSYDYPPEVQFQIAQDHLEDYRRAAEWINASAADVVCVQHEYGIFGGPAGTHLSVLLQNVAKPVVTTMHTVLKEPAPEYEAATREVVAHSDMIAVMSRVAREILVERYGVPQEKVALIYHGVPDVPLAGSDEAKRSLGLDGRFVVLTFGLLSQNKGIETVIEALPPVVAEHPDLLYVVLGATHPEVKKHEGERYRESLQRKARELALQEHVQFVDAFVDLGTLLRYIAACDVYITPYLHREQVVSGTLSYALAAGKAIISTPYWYAEELLAGGRGILVPFRDPKALSEVMLSLIGDPRRLDAVRRAAYEFGRRMIWPEVGKAYAALFERVKRDGRRTADGIVPRGESSGRAGTAEVFAPKFGSRKPRPELLSDCVAVIIAGGSGTRFWPLSTPHRPKQFLKLIGERTMLQHTFDRLRRLVTAERVLVLTGERFVPLVLEQLPELPQSNVIGEPTSRDTAAAVALAAAICRARFGNPAMVVLPADHVIRPVEAFEQAVAAAVSAARRDGGLYTFGVQPTYPATGYGYLEVGERLGDDLTADGRPASERRAAGGSALGMPGPASVRSVTSATSDPAVERYRVVRFKEKPALSVAKEYVASGRHFWNSGMFVWTVEAIMREIDKHLPEHARFLFPLGEEWGDLGWESKLRAAFAKVSKISIDFGVMEKAERVVMIKAPFDWSDVGGWRALSAFLRRDAAANAVRGQVRGLEARGNIVYCDDEREEVALVGVDDLVVVRVGSRTLVAHKDKAEEIKALVERIDL